MNRIVLSRRSGFVALVEIYQRKDRRPVYYISALLSQSSNNAAANET